MYMCLVFSGLLCSQMSRLFLKSYVSRCDINTFALTFDIHALFQGRNANGTRLGLVIQLRRRPYLVSVEARVNTS